MNTDELCNTIEGWASHCDECSTELYVDVCQDLEHGDPAGFTMGDLKALVRERNHLKVQNEHLQELRDELKAQLEAMHLKHGLPRRRWAP